MVSLKKFQGKTHGKYPFYKVGDISRTVRDGRTRLEGSDHYIDEEEVYVIKGSILCIGHELSAQPVILSEAKNPLRLC